MLIGISPLFSPELLATLYRMGHGDEIVLADARKYANIILKKGVTPVAEMGRLGD